MPYHWTVILTFVLDVFDGGAIFILPAGTPAPINIVLTALLRAVESWSKVIPAEGLNELNVLLPVNLTFDDIVIVGLVAVEFLYARATALICAPAINGF
jgi:hypothetical protein